MRLKTWSAILVLALFAAPALRAQEPAPPAPAPSTAAAAAPAAPAPAPKPYEDIIKLWRANLSEDFIKRQIETGSTIYDLSADEVIRCRDSGIPESLIQVMLETTKRKADGTPAAAAPHAAPAAAPTTPAAAPAAAPAATPAPAPAAAPANALAAQADRSWEGLALRNSGVVLFKSRWDVGRLQFKEELLRWTDAKDAGKNLLIPARQITEQFMTCLKKAGGNECFEWGFRTKDTEYRFRDVAWEQAENAKVQEIFDFFKALYPSMVSSTVPVDSK